MKPTPAHPTRAYNQVRRPEWPWANAAELAEAKRQVDLAYTLTNACAVSMANGHPLPPVPVAAAPPAPAPSARALGHTERRRRDDAPNPFSSRAAAAGEYLHPDE